MDGVGVMMAVAAEFGGMNMRRDPWVVSFLGQVLVKVQFREEDGLPSFHLNKGTLDFFLSREPNHMPVKFFKENMECLWETTSHYPADKASIMHFCKVTEDHIRALLATYPILSAKGMPENNSPMVPC